MNPTPTPRVDAAIERWKNKPWAGSPTDRPLMLARELERELAEAKADNDSLRTLWTEIRTVLIQSRAANCVCSYGKTQADAVEAANAVLNRMPPDVATERDQLRAEVAELRAWKEGKKGVEEYYQVCAERDQLRTRVAELEADKARLDWLEASPYRHVEGDYWDTGNPYWRCQDRKNVNTIACIGPDIRAAIDAARSEKGQP